MEHAGELLSCDFVHVRDHQQQALRGRVGGSQRTGCQRTVDGTGSTGLRLHLAHLDGGAEDVLLTVGCPLVHIVCHGRRRGDGVDTRHFGKGVADIRSRVVTVHGLEFSYHKLLPPVGGYRLQNGSHRFLAFGLSLLKRHSP